MTRECANTRCTTVDARGQLVRTVLVDGTGICEHCHRRLLAHLDELPDLYIELHFALQPSQTASAGSGTGGRGFGPRTPYSDEAQHLMEETVRTLECWDTWICDERNLTPHAAGWLSTVREGFALSTLVARIRAHVDFVTTRPDQRPGEDLVREVAELTGRIRFQLGAFPTKTRMASQCPRCQLFSLVRLGDRAWVECVNPDCRHSLTLDDYQQLAETTLTAHRARAVQDATARDADELATPLTAAQAAALVGVSVDLIWQWKKRGVLKANATSDDGKPRYLGIDVLRAEHRTRTQPAGRPRRATSD